MCYLELRFKDLRYPVICFCDLCTGLEAVCLGRVLSEENKWSESERTQTTAFVHVMEGLNYLCFWMHAFSGTYVQVFSLLAV